MTQTLAGRVITIAAALLYTLKAYNLNMVFIELSPFVAFRDEHWNDDEFRRFQVALMRSPKAGDVICGSGGLRKLRWLAQGRGKRGGARVIYIFQDAKDQIYLIYGYVKNEREDLTPDQVRALAKLMNDIKPTKDGEHG
jgi:hypothetical protein